MSTKPYRELLGSLLCISRRTRPDISYSVAILCRASNDPTIQHWEAAKRILRYLISTKEAGLVIGKTQDSNKVFLTAFSDSNWAGNAKDRLSTSGFVIYLNGSLIAWNTQKQRCVSLSSAEAEYFAFAKCVKSVIRTRNLLEEIGCIVPPSVIYEDNQPCINSVYNSSKRSKHVDVRYQYSKSIAQQGSITVKYCPTSKMVADMFRKALGPLRFRKCLRELRDYLFRYKAEEESCNTPLLSYEVPDNDTILPK